MTSTATTTTTISNDVVDDDESFTNITTTKTGNNSNNNKQVMIQMSRASATSVAVIGGGVTGLATAYHISEHGNGNVRVFESAPRLGGHAYTIPVTVAGGKAESIDVDIGFMVFNETNYPNMIAWFEELDDDVRIEDSDMSLSVSLDNGKTIEWSSSGLLGLFGGVGTNWKQAVSLKFYTFLKDLLRFNNTARELLVLSDADPRKHVTTAQYLRDHAYSDSFATYYLLPMMAALWSSSLQDVLEFPAVQLIGFLCNHEMLQLFRRPQWKTVSGRSASYVNAVQRKLEHVHVNTQITKIVLVTTDSSSLQYKLFTTNAENDEEMELPGIYDHVVFCIPPPNAAVILKNSIQQPSTDLIDTLKRIQYADNVIYVHSDEGLMPKNASCWSSWNCIGKSDQMHTHSTTSSTAQQEDDELGSSSGGGGFEGSSSGFGNTTNTTTTTSEQLEGEDGRFKAVYVTYWLNRLQNLQTNTNIFVSLNPHVKPRSTLLYERVVLGHPQFTNQTLLARTTIQQKHQGVNGLWFAGAWQGYGFHEDGCRAGFEVATAISGIPLPWVSGNSSISDQQQKQLRVLPAPNLARAPDTTWYGTYDKIWKTVSYTIPVAICRRFIYYFLDHAVQHGTLRLKFNDGTIKSFGDGTACGCDSREVTLRVFDPWFFVKTAFEYDLGLARSYMAGYFTVEPLEDKTAYHPVIRPTKSRDETTITMGDPVGLTRLFLLLIGNRDNGNANGSTAHSPKKSGRGRSYAGALTNASGLVLSKIGSFFNFWRYKLTMDNSERGGSLRNIHAHYDLSNDLFRLFLDKETLMYSSAIYDAIRVPNPQSGLVFRGTLEEAQWRKLDTLLDRAQVQPGQTLLDIGFGWGGLSLHAAKKYGCKVTGITLSVEQKALAEKRVVKEGLGHLITFEVIDYRTFARRKDNQGKFDRVLSCEMIEAVGHKHLGEFFWAVEQLLASDGVLVMEAITTPEERYENYVSSTDFINTIIFPGSCCPSLHALVDAAYQQSSLTLEHIDNIGMHYAQTLAEWRRRFNSNEDAVRQLGFDDVFIRAWNYYLTYCEAAFFSQTENCLILVFARPGCTALAPLCETRAVTQSTSYTVTETCNWLTDAMV